MTKTKLTVFGLAMLNVAAVLSLRGLPMMAETGLHMIFYLLFASLLFLIPCSLVSAELATGWPKEGGVYRWVKEAFGAKWGFVAIWLQWVQNVIWYPVILAFAASAFAYFLMKPELANNNVYSACFIIISYWLATLTTFTGLKSAERITTVAVIAGTIIPVILLICLSVSWLVMGEPISLLQTKQSWLPDFTQFDNVAFLAGIVLLFAGVEVGAVHVRDLSRPVQEYPQAMFISTAIIIAIFSLGAFSVAIVLPKAQISLTAGILQAFDKMLSLYHLHWMLPIVGLLVAFGAYGGVMAWVSGPSKGLLATAKKGEIPPFLAHTNRKGIQTHILLIQAVLVTVLASLYLIMDNVSTAFFLLSAMTITLYLLVYMLLFLSALRLRYTQPQVRRAYKVPGGIIGIWLVCLIGLSAVLYAFIIGFFPPSQLQVGTPALYVGLVIGGLVVFTAIPLIINAFKKPEWLQQQDTH
jgi:putative glutamate/gamma-aminobutyrate antiporter